MNPTLEWFLLTEHLVFLVPTTAALTLGILELASGGLSQAIGLDTDLDVDTDVDIDADLDGDLDLQSGSGGLFLTPLSWLGFGRAPLGILLQTMGISFGATGLVVSALIEDLALMVPMLVLAIPAALLASLVSTKAVGELIAAIAPSHGDHRPPGHYVGSTATVMGLVSPKVGQVQVRHSGEAPVLLNARSKTKLPRGTDVLLAEYDIDRKVYLVTPL